jgi:hypothetical protein
MKYEIRYAQANDPIRDPIPWGTTIILVVYGISDRFVSPAAQIEWYSYDIVKGQPIELLSTESTLRITGDDHAGLWIRARAGYIWSLNTVQAAIS